MPKENFSNLYSQAYDLLNEGKDYLSESAFVLELFKGHSNAELPKKILDLGCGSGEHISNLPDEIEHVTGVDLSSSMLARARQKNSETKFNFIVSDIKNYAAEDKFDLVMMLFHVLSYQTESKSLIEVFQVMKDSLSEDGKIIVDFWHRPAWEVDPPVVRVTEKQNETIKVKRTSAPSIDFVKGLVDIEMTIEVVDQDSNKKEFKESHSMRAFSLGELEILAESTGLKIIEFGDWNGLNRSPVAPTSWYCYAVMEAADGD